MNISVIGTGYVGLVQGTCLADLGNSVICIDKSDAKIKTLSQGECPFYEPRVSEMIKQNMTMSRLSFTTNLHAGISNAEIIFIAVGTPANHEGNADLTQIMDVVNDIGHYLKTFPSDRRQYRVLVMKSTVPVGTCQIAINALTSLGLEESEDFDIVSNPEFLREGSAVQDFFKPDRVVLGGKTTKALKLVGEVYSTLYRIESPLIKTNLETAELSKYASNAFLATKISFINEMANLCDSVGADIHTIAHIMGSDGRISKYFLHPGPGYGGSCFPKDTLAIVSQGKQHDINLNVINAAIKANSFQKKVVVQKITQHLPSLSGKYIGILGLAFKPNTDDMRDAPSIDIIQDLLDLGATIKVFDPKAIENAKELFGDSIQFQNNVYDTIDNIDALVVLTEWNSFRNLDFDRVKALMTQPIIIDARNMYSPEDLKSKGFIYEGIGRR